MFKRLNIINYWKKLITLIPAILVIYLKENDYNLKIIEMEKKITDHDHDKYISTQGFNKFTSDNFTVRLAQANLASKNYIANFVKKTNFDDQLKKIK